MHMRDKFGSTKFHENAISFRNPADRQTNEMET